MCGAPVLLFMAAGPEAEAVEALSDSEAVTMVVDALRAIFDKQGSCPLCTALVEPLPVPSFLCERVLVEQVPLYHRR